MEQQLQTEKGFFFDCLPSIQQRRPGSKKLPECIPAYEQNPASPERTLKDGHLSLTL